MFKDIITLEGLDFINFSNEEKFLKFPSNVIVGEDLYISNYNVNLNSNFLVSFKSIILIRCKIFNLPKKIKANKIIIRDSVIFNFQSKIENINSFSLEIFDSEIYSLPKNIPGSLKIIGSKIKKLISNLNIEKDLICRDFSNNFYFTNFKVGNNINFSFCEFEKLPINFKVNGSLILIGSQIKYFPRKLIIGNNLDLRYSLTPKLPKYLYIGNNLYLQKSSIKSFNNVKKVSGTIIF